MSFVPCHICAEDNIPKHHFKNYLCENDNHKTCTACSWNWFKQKLSPYMENLNETDKQWTCFFCRSLTPHKHQINTLIEDASQQGLISEKEKTRYQTMTDIAYAQPVPTNFRLRFHPIDFHNPLTKVISTIFWLTVFIVVGTLYVVTKVVSAVNHWLSQQTGFEPMTLLTIELNLMLIPLYMRML